MTYIRDIGEMIKDKGSMVAEEAENPTRCSTKLIYDVRTVDYT